jgi:hypothetical protein
MRDVGKVPYNFCWKVKLPLRIQIFIWLMLKKSILTRDALIHIGGKFEEDVFSAEKTSLLNFFFPLVP